MGAEVLMSSELQGEQFRVLQGGFLQTLISEGKDRSREQGCFAKGTPSGWDPEEPA